MYRSISSGIKALALMSVIGATLASPLEGQRSGVEIWSANCGRCHMIQPANRYDAKGWADIGLHMAITARLTTAETTSVIEFLQSAARRVALQEDLEKAAITRVASLSLASLASVLPRIEDPAKVYESQCVACHGKTGKGDGVAAVAFNPKPASFADPEFGETRTLEQVVVAITDGKAAMPPFAATMSPEDINALAQYLLKMSRGKR